MSGFTVVEVMIAVVIFSFVVLSLAGLAFQISKRSTRATDQALGMAVQRSAVDKAATVPFDSLGTILGDVNGVHADTVWSGNMSAIATDSVITVSANVKQVRIITTSSVAGNRPDTIVVTRGLVRYPIPLK